MEPLIAQKSTLYPEDGSFLTEEFISEHIRKDEEGRWMFDFCCRFELFMTFPLGHHRRQFIIEKFVNTLIHHPMACELEHLNLANSAIGNEFMVELCCRCRENRRLMPQLKVLNLETNYLRDYGIAALTECIADSLPWRQLEVVKLSNQNRHLLGAKTEQNLIDALENNHSIVTLSWSFRNSHERERVNNFLSRNMDERRKNRNRSSVPSLSLTDGLFSALEPTNRMLCCCFA